MNRNSALIAKLCPDRVKYEPLENILKIKNGSDYKSFRDGDFPVYGSGGIMAYVDHFAYDKPSVLIPRKGSIDKLYYVDKPFWNVDTIFYTEIDTKKAIPKYVYYCLLKEHLEQYNTGGGVPSLTQKVLNKVKIPVPSIEAQLEIVHILDKFTELINELTTELAIRKKQYEHYRDLLLNFGSDIQHIMLGDACYIKARIGWQRLTKAEYLSNGDYYLITGVDIKGSTVDLSHCWYVSKERYEMDENIQLQNGDIIVTKDGTIGKVAMISNLDKPAVLNSHLFVIRDKTNMINNRFLMYILKSNLFNDFISRNKTQGTIPGLNQATIIKFPIPVPSLPEQQRIVDILDRFDVLCDDIYSGIPAEIEARKKQFEYYRDKLLSFKELQKS